MSAIFGIISKDKSSKSDQFSKMEASLSVFSFDKINRLNRDGSFFGCGIQDITKESLYDPSPVYDDSTRTVFCSNCFLYNRDSLIKELGLNNLHLSDSDIALSAYKKWGFSFVERLRGNFCFVLYDHQNQTVHLYSDHFSSQYLVYHNAEDYFSFSSTYKPVLAAFPEKPDLNREFLAYAYQNTTAATFFKEKITPYKDVFHVDYATHITFQLSNGREVRERYWNPLKNMHTLKLKTDSEYKHAFRSLYHSLMSSMLRASRETGIMLSGGLDSSSVLAFAAPILKKRGKKIYSYTSIPCDDYVADTSDESITSNESSLIMEQKKKHENLEPHFTNFHNKSYLWEIDSFQRFYDLPIKTANNLNIADMLAKAEQDNCSIILSGSNGNASISYGYLSQYLSLNICHFHFIKAFSTLSKFCKKYRISRKKVFINWLKGAYSSIFIKPQEKHLFLKPEDEKKYGLTHSSASFRKQFGSKDFVTWKQRFNFLLLPAQFTQKGFYYTNLCLKHRMLQLDPSATIEMVEFCASLPMDCYVHDGIERCLIRDYLRDLLPEAITDMNKPFGRQCADLEFRINRDWNTYKDEIVRYLSDPILEEYLDKNKIHEIVSKINEDGQKHTLSRNQSACILILSSLSCFLKSHT